MSLSSFLFPELYKTDQYFRPHPVTSVTGSNTLPSKDLPSANECSSIIIKYLCWLYIQGRAKSSSPTLYFANAKQT